MKKVMLFVLATLILGLTIFCVGCSEKSSSEGMSTADNVSDAGFEIPVYVIEYGDPALGSPLDEEGKIILEPNMDYVITISCHNVSADYMQKAAATIGIPNTIEANSEGSANILLANNAIDTGGIAGSGTPLLNKGEKSLDITVIPPEKLVNLQNVTVIDPDSTTVNIDGISFTYVNLGDMAPGENLVFKMQFSTSYSV